MTKNNILLKTYTIGKLKPFFDQFGNLITENIDHKLDQVWESLDYLEKIFIVGEYKEKIKNDKELKSKILELENNFDIQFEDIGVNVLGDVFVADNISSSYYLMIFNDLFFYTNKFSQNLENKLLLKLSQYLESWKNVSGEMDFVWIFKLLYDHSGTKSLLAQSSNFGVFCNHLGVFCIFLYNRADNQQEAVKYQILQTLGLIYTFEAGKIDTIRTFLENHKQEFNQALIIPYCGQENIKKLAQLEFFEQKLVSNSVVNNHRDWNQTILGNWVTFENTPEYRDFWDKKSNFYDLSKLCSEEGLKDLLKAINSFIENNKTLPSEYINQFLTEEQKSMVVFIDPNDNNRGQAYWGSGFLQSEFLLIMATKILQKELPNIVLKLETYLKSQKDKYTKLHNIIAWIYQGIKEFETEDKMAQNQNLLFSVIDSLALKPEGILREWLLEENKSVYKDAEIGGKINQITSTIDINKIILHQLNEEKFRYRRAFLNLILRENLLKTESKNPEKQIETKMKGFNLRNNRAHTFDVDYNIAHFYLLVWVNCICIDIATDIFKQ